MLFCKECLCFNTIALSSYALACALPKECAPFTWTTRLPWAAPTWLQKSQRWGIAALRPVFLELWGWKSRYIETPLGRLHVYDAEPQGPAEGREATPLILQHGMFVTGWSMALLGWLLCRRGRRVVMPDLFDFDNGLSASDEEYDI